MIENEVRHDNGAELKHDTELIKKASSIKHGWHQTINDTVNFYQTPFDISVILEYYSNYNNLLR